MKLTREYLISYIKQNISSYEFVDMSEFSDDELIQLYEKAKTNKRNLKKIK